MDYITYKHLREMFREERNKQANRNQITLVEELDRTIKSLDHLVAMH